jgi:hypothetical protein
MKITPVDDRLIQIHLERGEDMMTAAPLVAAFDKTVAVQIVGPGLSVRIDRTEMPDQDPVPTADDQISVPHAPRTVHLSGRTAPALEVLRSHPAGLTSKRVSEILKVTHSAASSALYRMRAPIPLIERLPGGRFRLTAVGEAVTVKVVEDRSAARKNREIGWGPWMTTDQT